MQALAARKRPIGIGRWSRIAEPLPIGRLHEGRVPLPLPGRVREVLERWDGRPVDAAGPGAARVRAPVGPAARRGAARRAPRPGRVPYPCASRAFFADLRGGGPGGRVRGDAVRPARRIAVSGASAAARPGRRADRQARPPPRPRGRGVLSDLLRRTGRVAAREHATAPRRGQVARAAPPPARRATLPRAGDGRAGRP